MAGPRTRRNAGRALTNDSDPCLNYSPRANSGSRSYSRSRLCSRPAEEIHGQKPAESHQFGPKIICPRPKTWPAPSKLCIPQIASKGLIS